MVLKVEIQVMQRTAERGDLHPPIHQFYSGIKNKYKGPPKKKKKGPPKTCTRIFPAVSFVTASNWKQLKRLPPGEWISKLWYIQTLQGKKEK